MTARPGKGFTLIELMVVVVIICILLGFLSTALLRARDRATDARKSAEKATIAAAIMAFKHEYGYWPEEESVVDGRICPDENHKIMDYLDPEHVENPHKITFINRGGYRYWDGPNVRYGPNDDDEYTIIIYVTNGTVTVTGG